MENKKMETKNKNQMQLGTWDKIEANEPNKEKVKFDINIPRTLVFVSATPKEHTGEDGGAYYSFEVEENTTPKILNTSSWSLLRGIKALETESGTLAGRVAKITKIMVKGKQTFQVERVQ